MPQVIRSIGCLDLMDRGASCFPLYLHTTATTAPLLEEAGRRANLSTEGARYVASIGAREEALFYHTLAVLHSPAYQTENVGALRQDWPRIPLPDSRKSLEASAALGEQIAALLDTEAEVPGVTTGKVNPLFKTIGLITKTGGGQLDAAGNDLAVTAGWGHFGKANAVMPGKGKLTERPYNQDEAKVIDVEVRRLLGETTCNVYLNDAAHWCNIPRNVWEYTIGGYQVIKKWLSYREDEILGRALKPEEAREVMNTARRIAAIILLQPKLDENYNKVKTAAFDWPRDRP